MLRSEELTLKLENVKNKIKTLQVENKIEEAHAKLAEIENLKKEIEVAKTLEKEEAKEAENKIENRGDNKMEKVNILRAIINDMTNKRLTDAEKEAVKNSVDGESYILPQDISTKIRELIRDNKSFKNILGGIKTTATTGAFPIEDFESITELVDFEDGAEIEEAQDIRFRQVKFALKQKGAVIPLSNTLLAMTDNDLIDYVARVFARKAVATYNKMAVETLKQNKTVKTLADVKGMDARRAERANNADKRFRSYGNAVNNVQNNRKSSSNQFHNFKQRDTDYDALMLQNVKEWMDSPK